MARKKPEPEPIARGHKWAIFKDPKYVGGLRIDICLGPGPKDRDSLCVGAAIELIARLGAACSAADWVRTVKWYDRARKRHSPRKR